MEMYDLFFNKDVWNPCQSDVCGKVWHDIHPADFQTHPTKKRLVIAQRTTYTRMIGNIPNIIESLIHTLPHDWDIQIVQFGALTACDQIRNIYDASIMIAVDGAEESTLIFVFV